MDFWSSPEQLSKLSQHLQLALVIFGIITGLIGAASFVVSHRKEHLQQSQELRFKKQVQGLEQRTSDVRPLRGRHLTQEQKTTLESSLQGTTPIKVIAFRHNSKESQQFSSEIESALKHAGWTIEHFCPMTYARDICPSRLGIYDGIESLVEFDLLKNALATIGLQFKSATFQFDPKFQIGLDVGVVPANEYQSLIDRIN